MTRRAAAFYKIATHAAETADVVAHFDLLARGASEGRPLVALAMGSKGIASRILGPAHGGAFTFCALEAGRESAPGQLSLDEMTRLYRVDRIGAATAVTGLVGGRVEKYVLGETETSTHQQIEFLRAALARGGPG